MYLMNCGSFSVATEHQETLMRLLEEKGIAKAEGIDYIEDLKGNTLVEINDSYGDLEVGLIELVKELDSLGIVVNGKIQYYGDADGVYIIRDNVFSQYSREEYAVVEAMKTQEVISEPFAAQLRERIKAIQAVPSIPLVAYVALEEIEKLISSKTK